MSSIEMISVEQADALIELAQEKLNIGDPAAYIVIGLLLSGVRVNELLVMTWSDLGLLEEDKILLTDRTASLSHRVDKEQLIWAVEVGKKYLEKPVPVGRNTLVAIIDEYGMMIDVAGLTVRKIRWRYMLDLVKRGLSLEEAAIQSGQRTNYMQKVWAELEEMAQQEEGDV